MGVLAVGNRSIGDDPVRAIPLRIEFEDHGAPAIAPETVAQRRRGVEPRAYALSGGHETVAIALVLHAACREQQRIDP